MGCKKTRYLLSLYSDDQLEKRDIRDIKAHLDRCTSCREYYKSIMDIKNLCNNLGQQEVPLGFHDRLWEKLYKEEEVSVFKNRRTLSTVIGLVAVLMVIIIGSSMMNVLRPRGMKFGSATDGVASDQADRVSSDSSGGMYGGEKRESMGNLTMAMADIAQEEASKESPEMDRGFHDDSAYDMDLEQSSNVDRKIIKSAYLGIETLEFDVLTNNIQGKVSMMGGYIESSNVQGVPRAAREGASNRRANFVIRIPSKKFDQFINEVGELGNLITKEIGGEDVTGQYFDTQARIKSLTIQEQRLLTILEKAELLQDIIELESELSRVRYEIENYTGTLKRLDQLVNYSRVNIDIYEVKELKITEPDPETLGVRMAMAFKESLKRLGKFFEDLTVFLVAALPYLVLMIPLVWILWVLVVRVISSKLRKGKENRDE